MFTYCMTRRWPCQLISAPSRPSVQSHVPILNPLLAPRAHANPRPTVCLTTKSRPAPLHPRTSRSSEWDSRCSPDLPPATLPACLLPVLGSYRRWRKLAAHPNSAPIELQMLLLLQVLASSVVVRIRSWPSAGQTPPLTRLPCPPAIPSLRPGSSAPRAATGRTSPCATTPAAPGTRSRTTVSSWVAWWCV